MSWLFSRALGEAFSADICSDGEQCAPLSLTRMPRAYLCSDKMMGFCRRSPFGMTFGLSTEQSGEELLTWFLAGFHAKTLAAQEMAQESEVNGQAYGQKWRGSLAKYDHATHSLKTAQCSLFEDLSLSSVILPRWGTMLNGELYQQPIAERLTSEKESGSLLATPTATANQLSPSMMKHPGCAMWATPTTMDKLPPKSAEALEREATVARPGRSKPANLRDQVSNMQNWPTPRAFMHKDSTTDRGKGNLGEVVGGKLNPTWVEWLMGWPLGWTDLQPLAMDKFHEWQQQHSISYKGEHHDKESE